MGMAGSAAGLAKPLKLEVFCLRNPASLQGKMQVRHVYPEQVTCLWPGKIQCRVAWALFLSAAEVLGMLLPRCNRKRCCTPEMIPDCHGSPFVVH